MLRRLVSWCVVASSVGGCWTEDDLVFDAFTPEQWKQLQEQFKPNDKPDPCALSKPAGGGTLDCDFAAGLGQALFFEPRLSGPWVYKHDLLPKLPAKVPDAQTSCATCHDAKKWFIDSRPNNAVSMGAVNPTKHNTISLVNVAVGDRELYTWAGQCKNEPCQTTQNVVHDIALPNAMKSDAKIVGDAIRDTPGYLLSYRQAFGQFAPLDDNGIQKNVEIALDAYMRRLVSTDAPFDAFIAGNPDAISASARRGFALFVGRAMCVECHNGPNFTDGGAHVTGVFDPTLDKGYANTGAFYTPGLRHVAETAPYMHNGSLKTLADVLDLYRWGGSTKPEYYGTKDRLMQPFDMTDTDAQDLEAFMRALTGKPVASGLMRDTHVPAPVMSPSSTCQVPNNSNQGLMCNGICEDVANDIHNCGGCGNDCGPNSYCMGGMCGMNACPMPLAQCNGNCVDTQTDPANCGTCGNLCMTGSNCVGGNCQPAACPMPLTLCAASCVDTSMDAANCGSCGHACPINKPMCMAGTCKP